MIGGQLRKGAVFLLMERREPALEEKKPKTSGMEKIAAFIVDKRNLFFLLYILALIFSVVASGWVKVENDITTYLPANTETRQGLTVKIGRASCRERAWTVGSSG